MIKHTAAPWSISDCGAANAPIVIFVGDKAPDYSLRYPMTTGCDWLAEVKCDESERHEELKANARLMAASPVLLETLREFVAAFQTEDDPSGMEHAMSVGVDSQLHAASVLLHQIDNDLL